ncbi:MAG TPA: glycosyltransferase family 2 protein [Flavisolibacter sp.]|jgi:glycosyltransferase involved in cell wall biosynthesis|nr:glycosyltransferase family 2 protein [Flavisolibacter sp.]
MNMVASVIIPTHNRCASLKRMLENLGEQSFPQQNFEVIVVADGCKDDTANTVKNYKASFHLLLFELPGLGAASARNKGAAQANGRYLVFVDDDMELSPNFIEEHIASHKNENDIVIGYSPLQLEPKAGTQRMTLREWWEDKFHAMRDQRYRFRYDDLTSGNFSISNSLFKKVSGFDTSLLCREDYELGYRLIKAGANFYFCHKAKAIHRDEVTNLKRSLQRKKSEGIADMQIKAKHPDFVNRNALHYLNYGSFSKRILLRAIGFAPSLFDLLAGFGITLMNYFERFGMKPRWSKMNYRLHEYWYLRGLIISAGSVKRVYCIMKCEEFMPTPNQKLKIDLKDGLKTAEQQLDNVRPLGLEISFGTKLIGIVNYEAGTEPIKGVHLRKILKDRFSEELASVLLPEVFPASVS